MFRLYRNTAITFCLATIIFCCTSFFTTPAHAYSNTASFENGVYQIQHVTTGRLLSHNIVTSDSTKTPCSQFRIVWSDYMGGYSLCCTHCGRFLSYGNDIYYGSGGDYENEAWWRFTELSSGAYAISPVREEGQGFLESQNFALNKTDSSIVVGHTLPYTQWKLTKVGELTPVVADGTYYLTVNEKYLTRALDVVCGSSKAGAALQIYPFNGTSAQKFIVKSDKKTGLYTVKNASNGKYLSLKFSYPGSSVTQEEFGAKDCVQQWHIGKTIQGFTLSPKEDFKTYNIQCPVISRLKTVYNCSSSDYETYMTCRLSVSNSYEYYQPVNFDFTPVGQNPSQPKNVFAGNFTGTYRVTFSAEPSDRTIKYKDGSGSTIRLPVLDIPAASKFSKANVQMWAANASDAQIFIIRGLGNGYATIQNVNSGKYLDVACGSKKSGANVWQYSQNSTYAQQWKITRNTDNSYTITSRLSGCALDLLANRMTLGTNVQVWNKNRTDAQKWWFIEASPRSTYL